MKTTRTLSFIYFFISLVLAIIIPHIFDVLMNQCSCNNNNKRQVLQFSINSQNVSGQGSGTGSGTGSGQGSGTGSGGTGPGGTGSGGSGSGGTGSGGTGSGGTGSGGTGSGGTGPGGTGSGGTGSGGSSSSGSGSNGANNGQTSSAATGAQPAGNLPGLGVNPNQSSTIPGVPGACIPKLPLRSEVIEPHTHKYITNNFDNCSKRNRIFFLIVVNTLAENMELRKIIRNTWGSPNLYQKTEHITMFFMGKSRVKVLHDAVLRESDENKDIVMQDFDDVYDNLSWKSIMWLHWSSKYCKQAEYIVKVEDLAMINVFNLFKMLQELYENQENGYRERLICRIWSGMPVLRRPGTDWHITKEEHVDDVYPDYCSGLGYIVGKELAPVLHNASYYVPYFKVEDVFITGMLKKYVKSQAHNIWQRYVFNSTDISKLSKTNSIFGFTPKTDSNRYQYWTDIENSAK